jgi:hypothetical protein
MGRAGFQTAAAVALAVSLGAVDAQAGLSAAQRTGKFDLDCVLQHQVKRRVVSVRRHLRVDLVSQRWCEDLCENVYGLIVADDVVQLAAPPTKMGPTTVNRTIILNRKSGRLQDEHKVMMDTDLVDNDLFVGQCKVRPYSDVDRKLF